MNESLMDDDKLDWTCDVVYSIPIRTLQNKRFPCSATVANKIAAFSSPFGPLGTRAQ